jgi:hypothetical protein
VGLKLAHIFAALWGDTGFQVIPDGGSGSWTMIIRLAAAALQSLIVKRGLNSRDLKNEDRKRKPSNIVAARNQGLEEVLREPP